MGTGLSQPQGGATLGQLSLRALRAFPARTAFAWSGGQLSYAETSELIGRLQAVLIQRGLKRGMCVALLVGNRADAWCASVAVCALGASITWLHPMAALPDQEAQIHDAEAAMLIVDVAAFGQRGSELAANGLAVLTLGPADFGVDAIADADRHGTQTATDMARGDDVASLNYTGGTTGRSKGVMRRHGAMVASTIAIMADFEIPVNPRFMASAPISHVSGSMILPTFLRGGTIYLESGFDPERMLQTISRERINMALLVPTMIYSLLDSPELDKADVSSLELMLYGAAPMSPTRMLEALTRIGPVFAQLYGQTECHPIAYLPKHGHFPGSELISACGFPVASCDIALLNEAGEQVAEGEAGEICVKGPHVMERYWKLPEQTREVTEHGWLRTGDIATMNGQGCLFIVDRKKDMIVTGGFNVYPREVEDSLSAHPDVARVAVFGVPDEKWGEAVRALVVRRPGATADAQTLINHVKSKKGSLLAPKQIDFVDELPMTSLGKIDKKAARSAYWANESRQIG